MKITEAENALPNGLHDADLLEVRVDYANRTAALDFLADYSDPDHVRDEPDRRVTLLVTGLHFISIPVPDLANKYAADEPAWVQGFDPLLEKDPVTDDVKVAARHLPPSAFCERTFVSSWNSCLVIAAEDARIEMKE